MAELAENIDPRLDKIINGVSASYKEVRTLREELEALKQQIANGIDTELQLKALELDKLREQESHQWERALPLCSENTDKVIEAITAIKAEGVEINYTGSNGRSESLDYEDMLAAYQGPLAAHGVNVHSSLIPGFNPKDDDIIKTELRHKESGQFIASYSKIRISFVEQTMALQQKRSAAISYAKRHNLQGLLGL